ncbi:MAG: hypothetical protein MUF03_00680 [Rubrivivax sp.]|jgi:hypothetical protein|nr:hypothetical protein [Rubrivivax sp.]
MPLALRVFAVALAAVVLASPAAAESVSLSSAAGGSSASSASSASLETSSDSSSKAGGVAEGPYRILDVAELPGQPGQLRLTLQALEGAGGRVAFTLPQPAFQRAGLAAGDTVLARTRPYGTEFAHAGTREAFFLVVADDWMRELPSRPVVL